MSKQSHAPAQTPTQQVYSELRVAYDAFNAALFGGELPACLLTLQREKRTYGYYSGKRFGSLDGHVTDEIALNPEYFAVVSQLEVLQTLAHEMTHQWQAHHGTPGRGRYHNAEWADKMEAIGLMPSSTGRAGGKRTGDCMADYVIPDGPFVRVAGDLLGPQGLRITWFDRFAPAQPLYSEEDATQLASLPDTASLVPMKAQATSALVQHKTPILVAQNRSLRTKYQCPGCQINAWGKPGLRLLCEACMLPLADLQ